MKMVGRNVVDSPWMFVQMHIFAENVTKMETRLKFVTLPVG